MGPRSRRNRLRSLLGGLSLFLLVTALYAPSARYDFIYDDHFLIVREPAPRSLGDVARVFAERHWRDLPYYRPVARSTMVVQKFLHGNDPAPYHLFNAALMGVAALLAYTLFRQASLRIEPGPALLGAALLAAHPIASSCVYPVCSGRETLLPAVLVLAAVSAFLRPGAGWYVASLLALALALFGKEMAVVVPLLFVLADALGISAGAPGRDAGRWVRRHLPVLAVLIGYVVVRWILFGGTGEHRIALWDRPAGPLLTILYTLQTTFAPFVELVYEPRVDVWMSAPRQLATLAAVVPLATWIGRQWGSVRIRVIFWLGWILLALAPTANLMEQQARFAERFGFLALTGVIGIVATLASTVWGSRGGRRWVTVGGVVLILACAAVSVHRGRYFRSDFAFHGQWLRTDPESASAQCGFGNALVDRDRLDEAIPHLRRAVEIKPDFVEGLTSLGVALSRRGDVEESEVYLRRALEIDPDHAETHYDVGKILQERGRLDEAIRHFRGALELEPDLAEAHANLGIALRAQGRFDEAVSHLRRSLAIKPGPEAHYNLGTALRSQGRLDDALARFSTAVALDPAFAEAHHAIGAVLLEQGRYEEAIRSFRDAVRERPEFGAAHGSLAMALASRGEIGEAIVHFRRAVEIDPDDALMHNDLGAALGLEGRIDEAVVHFRRALEIDPDLAEARRNLDAALGASADRGR